MESRAERKGVRGGGVEERIGGGRESKRGGGGRGRVERREG